ncbi:MAG: hypothetical protein ABI597_14235 [Gammaproteobacteria bacterium]
MNQEQINTLIKESEQKGEKEVRQELAAGKYTTWKEKIVNNWLAELERKSEDKKHSDHLEINRSFKNSSWIGAITSVISAIVAICAAVIAFYNNK